MDRRLSLLPLLTACAFASLPVTAAATAPLTWLVDTGPGFDQGGGSSLYDDRPATSGYQSLAARFTLTDAVAVSAVEGWLNWPYAGRARFSILADFQGLPGGLRFSKTVALPATALNGAGWRGVGGLSWALAAGDYWLVFADAPGAGSGSGAMPAGAPFPLAAYASSPGISGISGDWMRADTLDLGVRIGVGGDVPVVPEPAVAWMMLAGLAAVGLGVRRRALARG